MLYTKKISDISYQDVVNFCDKGHQENSILEYKRDFLSFTNEKLSKTIASLANTFGGIIIIGVDAPKGKPIAPFTGFTFDKNMKYEEKIESIVLGNIKEPVFPEVRVCDPENGKTFIVIRVAESHLTPHRVANNSKIYIRTGQSSTPDSEATWDKIEWLTLRRKKSEDLHELLIAEGNRYFVEACKLRGIDIEDNQWYFAILSIGILPLFPQGPLVPYRMLDDIIRKIGVSSRGGESFPYVVYNMDTIQNGIRNLNVSQAVGLGSAHGKDFIYTHLNTYGLYLFKRDIGDLAEEPITKQKIKWTHFYRLSYPTYQALESATKLYQELGYWGSIKIIVELDKALGVGLPNPLREYGGFEATKLYVSRNSLRWEKIVSCAALAETWQDVAKEMIENMAWSLGIREFTRDRVNEHIKEYFRN